MNLENIKLCERSQSQKYHIWDDYIIMKCPEIDKSIDPRMPVTGVRAELGATADGFGVSFWGDENILKFNRNVSTTL